MTDDELIAKQAKRIAELEERCDLDSAARERVGAMLFGIGGPLNDDRLCCTKEQRALFRAIAEELWLS